MRCILSITQYEGTYLISLDVEKPRDGEAFYQYNCKGSLLVGFTRIKRN